MRRAEYAGERRCSRASLTSERRFLSQYSRQTLAASLQRPLFIGLAVAVAVTAPRAGSAQQPDVPANVEKGSPEAIAERARARLAKADVDDDPIDVPCTWIENDATRAKCWSAREAYYEYYITGREHRSTVMTWQHYSGRAIFVVVVALVLIGVYFSWIQFRIGMRSSTPSSTELELSGKGLKVTSPVLGVVILTLSLGFFYLYLNYVYPVSEVF